MLKLSGRKSNHFTVLHKPSKINFLRINFAEILSFENKILQNRPRTRLIVRRKVKQEAALHNINNVGSMRRHY